MSRQSAPHVDIEDLIQRRGVYKLTGFTPANDVRETLETVVQLTSGLDDIHCAQLKGRVRDVLTARKIPRRPGSATRGV